MDYELAKKLKDMGFPSKYKNWECKECGKPYEDSEVGTSCVSCGWNGARKVDVVFRAPTLSELIEACVTNKEERCFYRLFMIGLKSNGKPMRERLTSTLQVMAKPQKKQ